MTYSAAGKYSHSPASTIASGTSAVNVGCGALPRYSSLTLPAASERERDQAVDDEQRAKRIQLHARQREHDRRADRHADHHGPEHPLLGRQRRAPAAIGDRQPEDQRARQIADRARAAAALSTIRCGAIRNRLIASAHAIDRRVRQRRIQRQREHLGADAIGDRALRGLFARERLLARDRDGEVDQRFDAARREMRLQRVARRRQHREQVIDVARVEFRRHRHLRGAARAPRDSARRARGGGPSTPAAACSRSRRIAACISSSRELTPNSSCRYFAVCPPLRSRLICSASAVSFVMTRRRRRARRGSSSDRS